MFQFEPTILVPTIIVSTILQSIHLKLIQSTPNLQVPHRAFQLQPIPIIFVYHTTLRDLYKGLLCIEVNLFEIIVH